MTTRVTNLTFHGVGDRPRTLAHGEADVWITRERLEAVLDAAAGRGDVRLTFDDGNASDLAHGLPALRARGLTATFFVVAGRLGEPGFLGSEDVVALADAGMGIGCHGMCHRPWRRLSRAELEEELVTSRRTLEAIVGRPVSDAACPFGAYDRRVLGALRRAGYRRVYTSDPGPARDGDWLQGRNSVRDGREGELVQRLLETRWPRRSAAATHARRAVKRWR